MYTLFQTMWCVAILATLNRFTAYGTSWRPKLCSFFFLRDQWPRQHTLLQKWYPRPNRWNIHTLFQTKIAKSLPYVRLEILENDTLWGGTYLYGIYMGVPPCIWLIWLLCLTLYLILDYSVETYAANHTVMCTTHHSTTYSRCQALFEHVIATVILSWPQQLSNSKILCLASRHK